MPSVREERQVSASLISRLYGAAAREPSGTTSREEGRRADRDAERRAVGVTAERRTSKAEPLKVIESAESGQG